MLLLTPAPRKLHRRQELSHSDGDAPGDRRAAATKLPNVPLPLLVLSPTRDSTPGSSVSGLGGLWWRLAKARTKARCGTHCLARPFTTARRRPGTGSPGLCVRPARREQQQSLGSGQQTTFPQYLMGPKQ